MAQYLCIWVGAYWFSATLISKWPPGDHIGFFGFRTLTLVWLWISTPNFSGSILMYMGRSLLIFSNVNSKMAAWWPYWIFLFPDSNFSLVLNMNSKRQWPNTCWVGAYWFSAMSISKWQPGGHIGFFGSQTLTFVWLWIWTRNFNGPILVYMGRSLLIFS